MNPCPAAVGSERNCRIPSKIRQYHDVSHRLYLDRAMESFSLRNGVVKQLCIVSDMSSRRANSQGGSSMGGAVSDISSKRSSSDSSTISCLNRGVKKYTHIPAAHLNTCTFSYASQFHSSYVKMPEFSYLFYDRAALLYGLSFLGSSEKGKKRNLGRQPVVNSKENTSEILSTHASSESVKENVDIQPCAALTLR
ncbi:hypothetical protein GQX74_014175 [Glossina fuscipes]|nr:hypothetical protein GQX74_014175 [Glossina fuscipes]